MTKYACITGADRGLGLALAEEMLKRGYTVFAGKFASGWDGLDKLGKEWQDKLVIVDLNVADEASVKAAGELIAERTDRLDVIINNAGIYENKETTLLDDNIDYEQIHSMYNVNALGPLRVTQALVRLLLAGEDKLVMNISSEAGQINQTWRQSFYGYCMSKAALNSQSNIMHNYLRPLGGKVLVIHPGWMRTHLKDDEQIDAEAPIMPEQSAHGIALAMDRYLAETEKRAHPPFWNHLGQDIDWDKGLN